MNETRQLHQFMYIFNFDKFSADRSSVHGGGLMTWVQCRFDGFLQFEQESVCDNCNIFMRTAPFSESVQRAVFTSYRGTFKCVFCFICRFIVHVCIVQATVSVNTAGGNNPSRRR